MNPLGNPLPSRFLRSGHEIREEIEFYLDERARELEAQGLPPEVARRRAREAFGDPEAVVERVQREWQEERMNRGGRMVSELWQDLNYALRAFIKQPVFALAAGITLALAIGANAAIFGIADAALLRRPPVRDPGTLVAVYTTCRAGDPRCASSFPDYLDYRGVQSLDDLAATTWTQVSASVSGESPSLMDALTVTGNYFDVLGVPPALGRTLQPGDDVPGASAPVAVLAYDTWRTDFGADPVVVGQTIRLNDVSYDVVGVAPEGFRGVALRGDPDLFLPLSSRDLLAAPSEVWADRDSRWMQQLSGRLAPGATVEQLQQEMDALSANLNETYPDRQARRITVDASEHYSLPTLGREDLTRLVGVLLAVVALTLVLAAANVANLMLARSGARAREMGVRLALGSTSGRIVRQMLVESVTLSLLGGVAGLAVAYAIMRSLSGYMLPGGVPLEHLGVGIDGRVFAFALALSALTGLVFGVVPAMRASRRQPASSLRAGAHASRPEGDRLRKALVTAQVCASLVLVTGAGLFLRGLRSGLTYDLGVEPERVALARFNFSLLRYQPEQAMSRVDDIIARVKRLPNVTSASVATNVPLQIGRNMGFMVQVDGYQPAPGEEMRTELAFATEGFFQTLGTSVVSGRDVDDATLQDAEPQLIINQEMADSYWTEGNAGGGTVHWRDQSMRVVGVTENAAWRFVPQPPANFMTASLRQYPDFATNGSLTLAVRTDSDPEALLEPIRQAILAAEPNLTFQSVETMEDLLGTHLSTQRMGSLLLTLFGGLALVLSFVGIGGVVAYIVSRQKREIGIRVALGASRAQVQRGTIAPMLLPICIGLVAGLFIALKLGGSIQAFLIDASAADPSVYGAAAGLLAAVAVIAAWLPARRAARVDPVRVLKAD